MAKRADIKVGYSCNNNCRHCVVADKRAQGDKTTEEYKRDLEDARKNNVEEVVITGGEPTIRRDFLELVRYAKKLGYKLIQLQTNARMFYYKEFAKRTIEAGVNEFVPALHAHKPEIHDYITRVPNSFNQTVQGIKNLRELGAPYIIVNTVVTNYNYRILPHMVKFFVELKVDQFQFAWVHPCGNAYKNFDDVVPRMCDTIPYIKKALDIANKYNLWGTVEAVPFCLMKGYEKHILELYIPTIELREPNRYDPNFSYTRKIKGKVKGPECKECRFYAICEGVWREYVEKRGFDEFKPVKGERITNSEVLRKSYE